MDQRMQITVTKPSFPPLDEFIPYLADIWQRKILTNNGYYHQELEKALCKYLKVPYISIFTNGTLPLLIALEALEISGEVITTPYSFVATTHALWRSGIKPIFVDVEEGTGNLDPRKIEAAITPRTTAIMPVHVYGTPCDTEVIQRIADKHALKVIYDAAHTFGVEKDGKSVLAAGDISTLSFHATKVFNTAEGGALVCKDAKVKEKVDRLKNFGFINETTVVMPGTNGKMDEIRAAFGLLNLKYVTRGIEERKRVASLYRRELKEVSGIRMMDEPYNVKPNFSYFPILVDKSIYGQSRDALYEKLKSFDIYGRRYFYPLTSTFPPYKDLKSASTENLPVATKLADSVICLPIYEGLETSDVQKICEALKLK